MIDLRGHKDLIRELVSKENEKDPNYRWSVKSIGKSKVRIEWGYLVGLDNNTCFSFTAETDEFLGDMIIWRHPTGEMLSFSVIGETYYGKTTTVETAIQEAVRAIAYYAHSRY